MAVLRNTGRCAIIVPFMDIDTGLVAPGQNIADVPAEAMACDFIQGCIERGELFVVDAGEAADNSPSMDDLRAEAEALGIEVSKRWSRDTLVARIAEARGE